MLPAFGDPADEEARDVVARLFPSRTVVQIPTLEALRNLEMMAMGRFYIDEYGNARYEGRYARNV